MCGSQSKEKKQNYRTQQGRIWSLTVPSARTPSPVPTLSCLCDLRSSLMGFGRPTWLSQATDSRTHSKFSASAKSAQDTRDRDSWCGGSNACLLPRQAHVANIFFLVFLLLGVVFLLLGVVFCLLPWCGVFLFLVVFAPCFSFFLFSSIFFYFYFLLFSFFLFSMFSEFSCVSLFFLIFLFFPFFFLDFRFRFLFRFLFLFLFLGGSKI